MKTWEKVVLVANLIVSLFLVMAVFQIMYLLNNAGFR